MKRDNTEIRKSILRAPGKIGKIIIFFPHMGSEIVSRGVLTKVQVKEMKTRDFWCVTNEDNYPNTCCCQF